MADQGRWSFVAVAAALLGLGGCAAADKPVPPEPVAAVATPPATEPKSRTADAGDFEISLHRGPCYGRCPQYSVSVQAGGRVIFHGELNVAAKGEVQGQADPAQLAALIHKLRSPELAALRDIYRPGQRGCGMMATDMPSSRIEWQLDGRRHRINYYAGCSGAPEALRSLPAAIDAAAGTRGWIEDGVDR